jgi:hypothetical protein
VQYYENFLFSGVFNVDFCCFPKSHVSFLTCGADYVCYLEKNKSIFLIKKKKETAAHSLSLLNVDLTTIDKCTHGKKNSLLDDLIYFSLGSTTNN